MGRFAALRRVSPLLAAEVAAGYNETMACGRPHWADTPEELTVAYRKLLADAIENRDGLADDDPEAMGGAWACGRDLACARMALRDERRAEAEWDEERAAACADCERSNGPGAPCTCGGAA